MVERQGRFVFGDSALLQGDARMLLLCHPHNPTGRVFNASELEAVARWVERRDIVVISDELHADLMLDGRIHQPFAKLFPMLAERTVTLCSPSKAFALGGLGCVVLHFGSPELERRFHAAIPPDLLGEPAVPSLVAAEAAWREGGAWLKSLTGLVERNRDGFMAEIAARAPELVVHRPDATYFLWLDLRRLRARRRPFDLILRKGRVAVSDGALYGEGFDGFVRIVTATSPERMSELTGRLLMALRA
jgi:cystathionine beta-lyase